MDSTRRLAAILFADIAGYTALMQQDERQALTCLHTFKQELETQVSAHHGEIIQYYGDACLVIFQSSVDAVSCAMGLQQAFRQDPGVPVRIGLHAGEVVLREGNVFGNAVNIASRIESMGIPGSVLMSSSVQNQIKNQPEFRLISLGRFEFKNVAGSMTVYALSNEGLTLPRPEAITGKLKEKTPVRKPISPALIGIALLLIVAAVFGIYRSWQPAGSLSRDILESRIAVIPFENKTNNQEMEVVGDLAADYIIQGMMNLDRIKVVSYETMKENVRFVTAGGSPGSFAERTGAEKLIRGSLYQEGDQLLIQSQIVDLKTGELEFALPEIKGPASAPGELVQELQMRVLGFFNAERESYYNYNTGGNAPKIKAFEAYRASFEYFMVDYDACRKLLEEAIRLDSTYFWPHQMYFLTWSNMGNWQKADSVVRLIDRRFPNMNNYESLYQQFNQRLLKNKGRVSGDIIENIENIYEKDPIHYFNNLMMGLVCLYGNLPHKGAEAMGHINPAYFPTKYPVQVWWHGVYAFHLLRLDREEEARRVLSFVPEQVDHYVVRVSNLLLLAKAGDQEGSLSYLLRKEKEGLPPQELSGLYLLSATYFGRAGNAAGQQALAGAWLSFLGKLTESIPVHPWEWAHAHWLAGHYDQALDIALPLCQKADPETWALVLAGWVYGQEGKQEKAQNMLNRLGAIDPEAPWLPYAKARILAGMGDFPAAMDLLERYFAEGHGYAFNEFDLDAFFKPMLDYPPFVARFARPKG